MTSARTIALAVAILAFVPEADAGTLSSGISGVVLNATCPGPCVIPPPPLPFYEGDDLTVVIRSLPERAPFARLHPKNGLFGIEAPPGLYRVRAFVGNPKVSGCWKGSTRRLLVEEGAVKLSRLKVRNICVQ